MDEVNKNNIDIIIEKAEIEKTTNNSEKHKNIENSDKLKSEETVLKKVKKKPKKRDMRDLYRLTLSTNVKLEKDIIDFYEENLTSGKSLFLKECLLNGHEFIKRKLKYLPRKDQNLLFDSLTSTEDVPDLFAKERLRLISAIYTLPSVELNKEQKALIFDNDEKENIAKTNEI